MRFRWVILGAVLASSGCGTADSIAIGAVAGSVAAIPVFGRGLPDLVYSALTGRDCSIVYLDAGRPFCRVPEPPPETPRFCTRSLGVVDCWADAALVPGRPRGVADGATRLTPAQEANRTRRWPDLGL